MHDTRSRFSRMHLACVALALAGCVPTTYVYDDAPAPYDGGGYGHHAPSAGYYAYPGYYAYAGYYAYPGYYAYSGYYGAVHAAPRLVYHHHDHRGDDCRHESHRERRPPGDRDGRDHGRPQHARDDHPQGPLRGVAPPADRPPPAPNRCAGKKCANPGAAPGGGESQDPRAQVRRGLKSRTEDQRDQD